jgi:hypothetical protein
MQIFKSVASVEALRHPPTAGHRKETGVECIRAPFRLLGEELKVAGNALLASDHIHHH